MRRRVLAIVLSVCMVAALVVPGALAATDYDNHWARNEIARAIAEGWLREGNTEAFRPGEPATRAEFIDMINHMMGYAGEADISAFTDVSPDDWYYKTFSAAVAAGYVEGDGTGKFNPNDYITRAQAFVIFARISALNTSADNSAYTKNVSDWKDVPDWARGAVAASVAAGFVNGNGGKLMPGEQFSRGEAAVLLGRKYDDVRIFSFPGVYALANAGSVIIQGSGVTLKDTKVAGDLTIAESVGSGEVTLDGVEVSGKLNTLGGGANSVHLKKCKIQSVVVSKEGVRVVFEDGTTATYAIVEGDGAVLEFGNGVKVESLTVEADAAGVNIVLDSGVTVNTVNVAGEGAKIEMSSGATVNTLSVEETAAGASVAMDTGAKIGTANLAAATEVSGKGTITTANITAASVVIETKPTTTVVSSGVTAEIAGDNVTGTASSGGGGGSSSGGGSNNNGSTTYTVTFNSNGGTSVAQITGISSGTKINAPVAPTKSGNTFMGWYKDSSCTVEWVFSSDTVTGSITLYAKWIPVVAVPGAPQSLTAVPGDTRVTLSWSAPASDGGAAITEYQYTSDNGISWHPIGDVTTHVVNGLTNGTQYTFKVRAVNSAGVGAEASTTATPVATASTYTATVNIYKDGSVWNAHQKTVTLQPSAGGLAVSTASGDVSALEFTVTAGTWKVLVGGVDTGAIVAHGNSVTLNYYTVQFAVTDSGNASGSGVSATYKGSGINTNDVVLGGGELIITATGAGANSYTYAWSGTGGGIAGQITNSVTVAALSGAINVSCAVTGTTVINSLDGITDNIGTPTSSSPAQTTLTVAGTAKFTASTITWTGLSGGTTGNYEDNSLNEATITLSAKSNYTFEGTAIDEAAIKALFTYATSTSITNTGDTLKITLAYLIGTVTSRNLTNLPAGATHDGVTATMTANGTEFYEGQTVTLTITFSGTGSKTGTSSVTVTSASDVSIFGGGGVTKTKFFDNVVPGGTLTFTFVMPAKDVGDLQLAHTFTPATASLGTQSGALTALTQGTTTFTLTTAGIPSGKAITFNNLPDTITSNTHATTGNSTTITLNASNLTQAGTTSDFNVTVLGITTGNQTITIGKATPTVQTSPTATAVNKGDALSTSQLSGGRVNGTDSNELDGTWNWQNDTTTLNNTGDHTAVFTPNDAINYNTVNQSVNVTVNQPAAPEIASMQLSGDDIVINLSNASEYTNWATATSQPGSTSGTMGTSTITLNAAALLGITSNSNLYIAKGTNAEEFASLGLIGASPLASPGSLTASTKTSLPSASATPTSLNINDQDEKYIYIVISSAGAVVAKGNEAAVEAVDLFNYADTGVTVIRVDTDAKKITEPYATGQLPKDPDRS